MQRFVGLILLVSMVMQPAVFAFGNLLTIDESQEISMVKTAIQPANCHSLAASNATIASDFCESGLQCNNMPCGAAYILTNIVLSAALVISSDTPTASYTDTLTSAVSANLYKPPILNS